MHVLPDVDRVIELLATQHYVADRRLATAVFLALKLNRPLLLEGEAGVGKTELAKALSAALATPLIRLQCYEGLDVAQAAYEWNVQRQMLEIRLAEAVHETDRSRVAQSLYRREMLIERPLLAALTQPRSPVLLIDELDRADEPFEAFLLETLAERQITIPELGTIRADHPPIVLLTSNRTREIHDALRRRCLYAWVDYPDAARELEILRLKAPGASERLSNQVVAFVQRMRTMDLFKAPGVAEAIDWTNALLALDAMALDPQSVESTLGVLLKYQDDIARFQGGEIAGLLDELRVQGALPALTRGHAPRYAPAVMPQRLADNILHFARVLRAAGLPVGTDRALCAVQAIEVLGVGRRDDLHAALSAVMLDSHEQQVIFDAAFAAFWRDPKLLERLMYLMLPKVSGRGTRDEEAQRPRRVDEALAPQRAAVPPKPPAAGEDDEEQTFDAIMTHSERERLQVTDFESMSADEFALARRMAESIDLPLRPITSRRRVSASRGQIDLRASLRTMPRNPDAPRLAFDHRKRLRPPLVILIDISGSMERYSRAFLHFAHGLSRRHRGTHTFVFGTRLTDISRCLRHRDPDQALALAGKAAQDWRGGTRIASSLDDFNRHWARRVLTGNASLLLVTDGLDRDDAGELGLAAAELARWAREIIWLNPLLRYDGFEPKAAGIRALLPHAKAMIPVHDLRSLADIAQAVERQRSATMRKQRRAH